MKFSDRYIFFILIEIVAINNGSEVLKSCIEGWILELDHFRRSIEGSNPDFYQEVMELLIKEGLDLNELSDWIFISTINSTEILNFFLDNNLKINKKVWTGDDWVEKERIYIWSIIQRISRFSNLNNVKPSALEIMIFREELEILNKLLKVDPEYEKKLTFSVQDLLVRIIELNRIKELEVLLEFIKFNQLMIDKNYILEKVRASENIEIVSFLESNL